MTVDISSKIDNDTNTNSTIDTNTMSDSLASQVIFYIFLLLDVPSILCSLVLFYYFLRPRGLRQPGHSNQMIIYLLLGAFLINAIDIPLMLPYFQNHYYIESMKYPHTFCVFWKIYDYGLCSLNLWLMTLLSLERYLFIFFKAVVMKNKQRRFFIYYGLVTVIVLFVFLWYLYLGAFYPCSQTHQFDLTQIVCGLSCYETDDSAILQNFDWVLAGLLPVFLTIFFTMILILHVLYQKHKISKHLIQRETWKHTRKMILQLLPITMIYLLFNMPLITVGLLSISNPWYSTTPYFYFNSLSYCFPLSIPFTILFNQRATGMRLLPMCRPTQFNRTTPVIINTVPIRKVAANTVHRF